MDPERGRKRKREPSISVTLKNEPLDLENPDIQLINARLNSLFNRGCGLKHPVAIHTEQLVDDAIQSGLPYAQTPHAKKMREAAVCAKLAKKIGETWEATTGKSWETTLTVSHADVLAAKVLSTDFDHHPTLVELLTGSSKEHWLLPPKFKEGGKGDQPRETSSKRVLTAGRKADPRERQPGNKALNRAAGPSVAEVAKDDAADQTSGRTKSEPETRGTAINSTPLISTNMALLQKLKKMCADQHKALEAETAARKAQAATIDTIVQTLDGMLAHLKYLAEERG